VAKSLLWLVVVVVQAIPLGTQDVVVAALGG
jgi:hypothetical protein